MAVGSWLAIIAVCAKHRSLPAAKVSARVVSSESSMELNVGDRVTRYDVFGMCYYEVPKSVVGSTSRSGSGWATSEPKNGSLRSALSGQSGLFLVIGILKKEFYSITNFFLGGVKI